MIVDELITQYRYKKLPFDVSEQAKAEYLKTIPSDLKIDGDQTKNLYTKSNTLIAIGYDRIVVGDYGAFIEIDPISIILPNICVKKNQEYRIFDSRYSKNVKYFWYTANDDSDIKIYYQKRTVDYADYRVGKYYISPLEIL